MDGWVWSNGGMVLTGENWSTGRKTLYSVGGRWMDGYGAMVEWYWQGKTEVLEKTCPKNIFSTTILHELTWIEPGSLQWLLLPRATVWSLKFPLFALRHSSYRALITVTFTQATGQCAKTANCALRMVFTDTANAFFTARSHTALSICVNGIWFLPPGQLNSLLRRAQRSPTCSTAVPAWPDVARHRNCGQRRLTVTGTERALRRLARKSLLREYFFSNSPVVSKWGRGGGEILWK